jgi:hypothetical protein
MNSLRPHAVAVALAGAGVTLAVVPAAVAADPPSVRHLRPAEGPVGTTVTLTVSGFTDSSPADVAFTGTAPPVVTQVSSSSTLSVQVPSGAATGPVTVSQGAASASSSKPFTVTVPTTVGATVSGQSVVWPQPVTVNGSINDANGAVSGAWLHVQGRHRGAKQWRDVPGEPARQSNKSGAASWQIKPARATSYRVIFGGNRSDAAGASPRTQTVAVAPRLRLHVGRDVPQLEPVTLTGDVSPTLRGAIAIQRRSGKTWHTIAKTKPHRGDFASTVHFDKLGALHLRAVRASDAEHAAGTSAIAKSRVVHRTLSEGDTGADVTRVQRRLAHLHYDVGGVTGDFGFDLLHAVTAFQKVQGLPDDGQVGSSTWAALDHPRSIHLRHPITGADAVEVNLAKQVVLLEKNGKVWRIVDSSTAGGYYYTDSEGASEKAVTPTGHFTVQYKVDHWVHSSLGYLYRPSYFTNTGYAIHGETEVPSYPASHGCVRITVPAMDRYYAFFYDGQSVWIYGNPPPGHE